MKIRNIISLILLLACLTLAYFWQGIYLAKNTEAQAQLFIVEKGQGLLNIAANLEDQDLIKNKLFFQIYLTWQGKSRQLQAGEYLLSPAMNIPEIAAEILAGSSREEKITIIEGWTLRNIGQYFEDKEMFSSTELFSLTGPPMGGSANDHSLEFDFLKDKPENISLEGYLFPDTYYIREKEPKEIINKALENFNDKLTPDLRIEIEEQNKTIFEIVTMASLLEKEVRTLEDKKLVSGILWKRLDSRIPLQSCATIIYILDKKTTKVTTTDTQIDSLYNTYKYPGLPLGPICNPGLESIVAAIYPEKSAFWYHLSTPEGETIFSRNLEEHNIAKARYLK